MKKVLVAYYSRTGMTAKMAEQIAEGIRLSGAAADLKEVSEIKSEQDLPGYDGYIFGCPTYHKGLTDDFKTFLFLAHKGGLRGKAGGSFGSSTHSGEAPGMIFDTMEFVYSMKMTGLGPLDMRESVVETDVGIQACREYGRTLGGMLSQQ